MGVSLLIASQQFKGSLSARAATEAIGRGVRDALPDAQLDLAPLADGGQGTVDAIVLSREDGEDRRSAVLSPSGRHVLARWGYLPDTGKGSEAIIEMAAASGLTLVAANLAPRPLSEAELAAGKRPHSRYDVLDGSTFGTGQLIRAALDAGCARIQVGAGDSGTCDGGIGAATALGCRFFDANGAELPKGPRHLRQLARIDLGGLDPRLTHVPLTVLCDARNPLLGAEGTARVYGPQKGADADAVELLEAGLEHLSLVVKEQLGKRLEAEPGGGAAGGLGYGLAALCNASLKRGFDAVSEALGLFQRVSDVDVVITGEGQIDAQTSFEKGPWSLGRLAHMQKKRVVAFAGAVVASASSTRDAFDEVITVTPKDAGVPSANQAAALLEAAAKKWALSQRWK
jgi:glycerate kinase